MRQTSDVGYPGESGSTVQLTISILVQRFSFGYRRQTDCHPSSSAFRYHVSSLRWPCCARVWSKFWMTRRSSDLWTKSQEEIDELVARRRRRLLTPFNRCLGITMELMSPFSASPYIHHQRSSSVTAFARCVGAIHTPGHYGGVLM